jgi:hypothetical protein
VITGAGDTTNPTRRSHLEAPLTGVLALATIRSRRPQQPQ